VSKALQARARALERSAARERRSKAVRRFRSRKAERQGYVVINAKGKRVGPKGKGFLIYVSSTGRKTLVNNPRLSRDENLRPQKRYNLGFAQTRRFKRAQERFFATHQELTLKRTLGRARGRSEVDYATLVRSMAGDLARYTAAATGGDYVVEVTFTVRPGAGRTFTVNIPLKIAPRQKITLAGYRHFVRKVVWAFVAQALSDLDLVTTGSARNVRKVSGNWNKPQKEWKGKDGQRWEKNEYQRVRLVLISWLLKRVVVQSGSGKGRSG
jgi:hypothetical protein